MRLAEALLDLGVEQGDTVGIFLPMAPEALIASHACSHIGAMQVPIFSGFAGPAVSARLADAGAKVVICADASYRRGHARADEGDPRRRARRGACRRARLVWRRMGGDCPMTPGRDLWWAEAVAGTPGDAAARGARERGAVPARIHVRHDRENRRERCTSRRRSCSRSRARPPTRRTCTLGPRAVLAPTWAGSWARGRSSARARSAPRSCSWRARPTGPTTGSGGSSRRSA